MSKELYAYLQQMHYFIQTQNKRIAKLEENLKEMKDNLNNLKKKPPVYVDNIEYKFDQLKVETLDGVLNIGLNPGELDEIDNFEVDNSNQPRAKQATLSPKKKMETTMKLEDSLYRYLDTDLNSLVKECGEKIGINVNEDFTTFIKEDIKKQLPTRINDYLNKFKTEVRSDEALQSMMNKVEKQMKEDIKNAVFAFLNNLPKQK